MNIEEIKARAEAAADSWLMSCHGRDAAKVCAVDVPALIAEVERLQKENLSSIATGYYEEAVWLRDQLEIEILRRDSLDATLNSVVADHKRDKAEVERLQEAERRVSEIIEAEAELGIASAEKYRKMRAKLAAIRKEAEPLKEFVGAMTVEDKTESIKAGKGFDEYVITGEYLCALAEAIKEDEEDCK